MSVMRTSRVAARSSGRERLAAASESSPVSQSINVIFEAAIRARASDIHIEPRDEHTHIRYRIDGELRQAQTLPASVHDTLVAHLKAFARLNPDEHRVPQDGRFRLALGDRHYTCRISIVPITSGEKVVLRLLDESGETPTLEQLGYWGETRARLSNAIVQPHGMVLVSGPAGSGTSTSLRSILTVLNGPAINLSTIEDPVEHAIPGANQIQVNPLAGITFASGLRALLRQDPDILMIGELHQRETAALAVEAALSSHQVFSMLHTPHAATALTHLLDMGIEPFLVAHTIRAVVGQRLVRTLCTNCREAFTPSDDEIAPVVAPFGRSKSGAFKQLHELEKQAASESLGSDAAAAKLSTTTANVSTLWHARDGGCEQCDSRGYWGRTGIYEVLVNTADIQQLILAHASDDAIHTQAVRGGMITMQMDGLVKALRGLTSVEEVLRVTSV